MNEIYTVTGKAFGSFKDEQTNKIIGYTQLFATTPFPSEQRDNFHGEGLKACQFKVADPDVLKDVKVGQRVLVFFNEYKKVSYVAPAPAT